MNYEFKEIFKDFENIELTYSIVFENSAFWYKNILVYVNSYYARIPNDEDSNVIFAMIKFSLELLPVRRDDTEFIPPIRSLKNLEEIKIKSDFQLLHTFHNITTDLSEAYYIRKSIKLFDELVELIKNNLIENQEKV